MHDAKKKAAKNPPAPRQPSAAEPSAANGGNDLAFQLATQTRAQTLQRKAGDGDAADDPPSGPPGPGAGSAVAGAPLDPLTRSYFELRFGQDFGAVRVHTGGAADRSARDVNALAYTLGDHLVFRDGLYSPSTHDGRRLLAHELTHVVQQRATGAPPPARARADADAYAVGEAHSPSERAAEAVAERAVSDPLGARAPTDLAAQAVREAGHVGAHKPVLQRAPDNEEAKPFPLVVSGATFGEAAQNFAKILESAKETGKARVVIVNGANVRAFDHPRPRGTRRRER